MIPFLTGKDLLCPALGLISEAKERFEPIILCGAEKSSKGKLWNGDCDEGRSSAALSSKHDLTIDLRR